MSKLKSLLPYYTLALMAASDESFAFNRREEVKRENYILYARTASGGVSQQKAELYTDNAIMKVFEQVCSGTFAVASPIASIKWHINHAIKNGRRKRTLNYKKL